MKKPLLKSILLPLFIFTTANVMVRNGKELTAGSDSAHWHGNTITGLQFPSIGIIKVYAKGGRTILGASLQ